MKKSTVMAGGQWADYKSILFLAGLIILFYHRVIFGNSTFVFVDASRFFYPLWKWGAGVLNQGFIPLWNPDAQFGTPYFADPQMAYAYPPVPLLYSRLDPTSAFNALIILHHLWALLGFWFFGRGQGFSIKASLLGSFIFGFSLHIVCSSWTPVALMTISWIPWVFLSVEKIVQNQKGGWLYLSLAWAMQFAAGYPVLTYLTAIAVGLHLIWRLIQAVIARSDRRIGGRSRRSNPSLKKSPGAFKSELQLGSPRRQSPRLGRLLAMTDKIKWIFLAGLVAAAYNLVWGLPFLELFRLSNYEEGAGRYHDLGWLDLATALNPFVQGHPLGNNYHGPHYWVSTYFVGLPALCLLLWGAIKRVYWKSSPAIFLIFLALSLGVLGAGKMLAAVLPGYSLVIHSGYWIAFLVFWAAWMSMESTDGFLDPPSAQDGRVSWLIIVALVYGIFWGTDGAAYGGDLGVSFFFLIGSVFVKTVRWKYFLLFVALFLSLGLAAGGLNILLDRSYYQKPPQVLSRLNREGRLFFPPPLMKEAVRLQGNNMPEAYDMAKQKMYPNWPLTFGKEQSPLYNTIQLKDSFAWTFQAFQYSFQHSRRALDYLHVRYVFGRNQFKDMRDVGVTVMGRPSVEVEAYENPTALPKWFSIESALPAGASLWDDFTRAVKERVDYGKMCFIPGPAKAGTYHPRRVTVQTRWPNRLALTAVGKGKALVISSETAYPGWKAWVEGKEKTVELINHAFRGVFLEEGETRMVFQYEPMTFRLGLFFSLVICGLWFSLLWKELIS